MSALMSQIFQLVKARFTTLNTAVPVCDCWLVAITTKKQQVAPNNSIHEQLILYFTALSAIPGFLATKNLFKPQI